MKLKKLGILVAIAAVLVTMTSGSAFAAQIPDATSRMTSGAIAQWTGSTGSTDINPPEWITWDIAYKNELQGESINAMSNYKFGSGGQVWPHTIATIPSGSTWKLSDQPGGELFTTTAQNLLDIYRNHYYWNDYRCSETWPYAVEDLY